MANLTPDALCPHPFILQPPDTGGATSGRFCGPVGTVRCCLPCPLEQWLYSDKFIYNVRVAYWFNVPALVGQVFLLLGFVILRPAHSRVHYLSVGLCMGLILLQLSFIFPLGLKPDQCHDAATPNDLHTDVACGWSGGLLEVGAMASAVWILLRSVWTNLRVCFDVQQHPAFFWISHALGWGLPALFAAISLPISGVSYQLGTTCFPNRQSAYVTWFGWLLAIACLAALIQIITTGFCLYLYVRHFWQHSNASSGVYEESDALATAPNSNKAGRRGSLILGKRLAWRRVKKVLILQWRSILLSVLVIIESIYFGVVYVRNTEAVKANMQPKKVEGIEQWAACLILSNGDKDQCTQFAGALGLSEPLVLASFSMSALIGIFTFLLMVRRSMFVGWYELFMHPVTYRRTSNAEPFVPSTAAEKRLSASRAPKTGREMLDFEHNGVLPEPRPSVPEAGDVSTRHETADLFSGDGKEESQDEDDEPRGRAV